jgi:hypothetical protein
MTERTGRDERAEIERALAERETDEARQSRGTTPPERLIERALEVEPGVEVHAGEDAGQVPREDDRASGDDGT